MLNEGYLISQKTISVDIHNVKDSKILLVGLAGAGKTTLGNIISKRFNILLRSTDNCPFDWNALKTNPELEEKFIKNYLDCCSKMILDNKKGILEGAGIIEVYEKRLNIRSYMLKYPCIIMGESTLKSGIRAQKRRKSYIYDLFFFKQNIKFYQRMLNKFRKDRTSIRGAKIKEYSLKNLENTLIENYLEKIQ